MSYVKDNAVVHILAIKLLEKLQNCKTYIHKTMCNFIFITLTPKSCKKFRRYIALSRVEIVQEEQNYCDQHTCYNI